MSSANSPFVFSTVKAKPVEFIWRDRFPKGMINVVAGRRDQGKGLFGVHVVAEITQDGGNVIYSAFEDDPAQMTMPRLVAADADLNRIIGWRFQLPRDFDTLRKRIVEHDIRLVVMDPFASHLSGGIRRESDSVRVVTDQMESLSEQTGVTWLIVEHMLKRVTRYTDPGDAVAGGSSGLPSAARGLYIWGTDPKDADRRLLAPAKLNVAEWPKTLAFETDIAEVSGAGSIPYLMEQEESDIPAQALFDSGRNKRPAHRPPDKRAAASQWLAERLYADKNPVKAGKIVEDAIQFGLTKKTLRNAADDMGVIRNPPGGGRNCTWALPPAYRRAMDKGRGK